MILFEETNSVAVARVGFVRAIPPRRVGRARRSRSKSLGGGLPVRAGINLVLMVCSMG